jgi:SAM-dependent methyltransferase
MDLADAIALLRDAVPSDIARWADFGAGTGTFTRALARILGDGSTIYAVDADASAVRALRGLREQIDSAEARIIPIEADFGRPDDVSASVNGPLDGILLANSLHFTRDHVTVLAHLTTLVRAGGRVVVVEYDRRQPSRWVPFPIGEAEWPRLAAAVGLVDPAITARRRSMYSGSLYVGVALKK